MSALEKSGKSRVSFQSNSISVIVFLIQSSRHFLLLNRKAKFPRIWRLVGIRVRLKSLSTDGMLESLFCLEEKGRFFVQMDLFVFTLLLEFLEDIL